MDKSIGQNLDVWKELRKDITPESEIRMWDIYGGRQWVLKYVPRFGKIIEAGCGMGRYDFYLSKLGFNIEGVDFDYELINYLEDWQKNRNINTKFVFSNISKLPYEDNSLNCCISIGVVEHFIEGPYLPISEFYRVLKPGGIAIIATPSIHFANAFHHLKLKIRNYLKKIFRLNLEDSPFFQYWIRPRRLKKEVEKSGLKVTRFCGLDLLYPFYEIGNRKSNNINPKSFSVFIANLFENTFLANFGAQSYTVSYKPGTDMLCFLCGENKSSEISLSKYDVPICSDCQEKAQSKYYKKGKAVKLSLPYLIKPPVKPVTEELCEYCGVKYNSDELFEDFGFSKKVCPSCLKNIDINIELSNKFVKPIWRKRHN